MLETNKQTNSNKVDVANKKNSVANDAIVTMIIRFLRL